MSGRTPNNLRRDRLDLVLKMTKRTIAVWPGEPYPLGATCDTEGVNFALFSEHAEEVELCLFDTRGTRRVQYGSSIFSAIFPHP